MAMDEEQKYQQDCRNSHIGAIVFLIFAAGSLAYCTLAKDDPSQISATPAKSAEFATKAAAFLKGPRP